VLTLKYASVPPAGTVTVLGTPSSQSGALPNRLAEEYGNAFREDLKESAIPSLGYWNATHGLQASVCCGNLAEPTSKRPVMDFCRRFQANLL